MPAMPVFTWTYEGPSSSPTFDDWPAWVVWLNFACNEEKFLVHTMDGIIVAYLGDTLHRTMDGKMYVVRAQGGDPNRKP